MSRTRYSTGVERLDAEINRLLDDIGATEDRDQLFEILVSGVALAGDHTDRLDLKITNAALQEMRGAFNMFAPYRDVPKVTIFGSARTKPDDPLYTHTVNLARRFAERDWMIVTGAGPGIMEAGMEGAGREKAIGVLIRLPFEAGANDIIAGDPKLAEMKYFFTRKLMLMKESAAFVALPGGFGTLDETFELLTLVQTGKAVPVPIVLLDTPGGTFWQGLQQFIQSEVARNGWISQGDDALYCITDSVEAALTEVEGFYRNYHSLRYVGDRLVIRLHAEPTKEELAELTERYRHILKGGAIETTRPFPPEISSDDHLELPRIALQFDRRSFGQLRHLIDDLNRLPSAPAPGAKPPTVKEESAAVRERDEAEAQDL
ncbi:MAG: log [Acidimicrobiales bacterium]|nr:log [Acidimicrobiales bacterium]